ncbi:MAG TPA: hypothetical protein VN253_29340, partial [Kofleriaceae bacterium]|nr:hypothetical protein [Kofleriaceae bacterium]
MKRLLERWTAIHVLLVVAILEVAINRIAVPMLRPVKGAPPAWHTLLDYVGLFLFYFAGTLAALVLVLRGVSAIGARRGLRDAVAHAILAAAALLGAIPLVVAIPASLTLGLELAFAGAVIALVASVYGRDRDLGIAVGLPVIAVPLLLHTVNVIGTEHFWPESSYDGTGADLARAGLMALCIAAMITPYCFAPRPFARAVTRPLPIAIATVIAGIGLVLAKKSYLAISKVASIAVGVEMAYGHQADPRLALYLLAVITLAWTLASCALAESEARRGVGAGLAFIVLGGYAFKWPHHYLLPLLGVALIADAARRVRDEELAAMPPSSDTPPIADTAWSTYLGAVAQGLRRTLSDVHSLTSREGGLASSLIAGEAKGRSVRLRFERLEGSVLALDVVLGREIDELRGATLTLWAIPARGLGVNPNGPPAAPLFRAGDEPFDERFKLRGSAAALRALFDDDLRARAVTSLDGWLAYWEREGLRYRVYPGRGAPLDHPVPLSDLALGRIPPPERLIAVVELLVEIAVRG